MNTKANTSDPLIKSSLARKEWGGISSVTEWRWTQRGIISPIKINGRNYYRQSAVRAVGNAA